MRQHLLAIVLSLWTLGLPAACADARSTDCAALTDAISAAEAPEGVAPGPVSAHYRELSAALGALHLTDPGASRKATELRRALNAAATSTDALAARGVANVGAAGQDQAAQAVDDAEKDLTAYCVGSAF